MDVGEQQTPHQKGALILHRDGKVQMNRNNVHILNSLEVNA